MASCILAGLAGPYTQTLMSMREEHLPAPVTAPSRAKKDRSTLKRGFLWGLECCVPFFGNFSRNDFDNDDDQEATEGNPRQTEVTADLDPANAREAAACEIVDTLETQRNDLNTPQTAEWGHLDSQQAADWSHLDPQETSEWDPFSNEEVSEWYPVDADEGLELEPIDPEQAAKWAAEWEAAAWDESNMEEARQWYQETMRKPEDIERPDHNVKNRLEANKLSKEAHAAKALLLRLKLSDNLGDELEEDSRNLVINNGTGHRLLDEGMWILREAFLETSRIYWRPVFRPLKHGRHLVDTSWTRMRHYFQIIELEGLNEALPRTDDLKMLMMHRNNQARNELSHPLYPRFANSSDLDVRLQIMQAAILVMGDQERFARLRDLRDQLAEETKRVLNKVMDLGRQAEDPFFEVSEDDLEFLDDWDVRFYNILYEQGKFDGHRLDDNDPMFRIARFYSKQCMEDKMCQAFANGGIEYY